VKRIGTCREDELLQSMSLREKIGQMTMAGFEDHFDGELPEGIGSLFKDPGLGSVAIFARNAHGPAEMRELTSALQDAAAAAGAKVPLFIMADQESGIVMQVTDGTAVFPGNMAFAATGDAENAYEACRIIAIESLAMGINAVCAPDVDVNADPDNPIIGIRAYSDDPAIAGSFGSAAVRGYAEGAALCMAKHFPGHGRTAVDSHLAVPLIDSPIEEIEALDLPPFREAICAGVPAVMTAHIRVPALDQTGTFGTMSRPILTELLRNKMGFHGLIITDCLEMGAIKDTIGTPRAAVRAVEAGADIVLMAHTLQLQREAIDRIEQAVLTGRIPRENIDASCRRILRTKLQLEEARRRMWPGGRPSLDVVGCTEHLEAEKRIARQSITLVRNDDGVLPFRRESLKTVAVVYPATMPRLRAEDLTEGETVLGKEIASRGVAVIEVGVSLAPTRAEIDAALAAAGRADAVVVATSCKTGEQEKAQGRLVQALRRAAAAPVVACGIRNPYDIRAYPEVGTYLVTYGYRPCSIRAMVEVLFGEIAPKGRLPVEIPGFYPRGYGLES